MGRALRTLNRLVPPRLREPAFVWLRRAAKLSLPAQGNDASGSQGFSETATRVNDGRASSPESAVELLEQLDNFLWRVDRSSATELVLFVAALPSEGNPGRAYLIAAELAQRGSAVLVLHAGSGVGPRPKRGEPLSFFMPLELFDPHRAWVIEHPYASTLNRTCVFEIPHPAAFQWVNELNLAAWNTVYDMVRDWGAEGADGYEPGVEQYLCANCQAVSAILPELAERARAWLPGLEERIVPDGKDPDSWYERGLALIEAGRRGTRNVLVPPTARGTGA